MLNTILIIAVLAISHSLLAEESASLVPYKKDSEHYLYPPKSAELAADKPAHLFILSGQSNMQFLDPKISFVPTITKAFNEDSVIIVKDALGSQPISRWYKDWVSTENTTKNNTGDLYARLISQVKSAIKDREIQTITFLWMQGEKDAATQQAAVYEASLQGVMNQIKGDLNWSQPLYFVIGRLSDAHLNSPKRPDWDKIRAIQVSLAESSPLGAWVDTDDLNNKTNKKTGEPKNDVHYTKKGYELFGERLANAAIKLIHSDAK